MLNSLAWRFIIASAILLPIFLGFTGTFLERAFSRSVYAAESERLHLQVMLLLAEADYEEGSLWLPERLQESKFDQANSGLYGVVLSKKGAVLWQSQSLLKSYYLDIDFTELVKKKWIFGAGEFGEYEMTGQANGNSMKNLNYYRYPITWITDAGDVPYLFLVLSSQAPLKAKQRSFRAKLWWWLGGVSILLLIAQALIMRWGLRPLGGLAVDLKAIEAGEAEQLQGNYPKEVQAITHNLNQLLDSERQQRERYRNSLADLAHSLKTPLAVMGSASIDNPAQYSELVNDQVHRMNQIVAHQLQRAQHRMHHRLLKPVAVYPLIERMRSALLKVYGTKDLSIVNAVKNDIALRVDESDLMELVGNIMDNACKSCQQCVKVEVNDSPDTSHGKRFVVLIIGDDGSGVPEKEREFILQRGARADTSIAGQGIGLAVAVDIVSGYGGSIFIDQSSLGGAEFRISLPVD